MATAFGQHLRAEKEHWKAEDSFALVVREQQLINLHLDIYHES
jgi:hypothetical protein